MPARRTESVAALVIAAAAMLLTAVFGFMSFSPGVEPGLAGFLEFGFYAGAVVAIAAFIGYFVLSRRAEAETSRFDRLLEQRAAALGSVPVGLGAVLVGVLWYFLRTLGEGGAWEGVPGSDRFAAIDTIGIIAFLGFGSIYVLLATYLAIRAERAATHLARDELEVRS